MIRNHCSHNSANILYLCTRTYTPSTEHYWLSYIGAAKRAGWRGSPLWMEFDGDDLSFGDAPRPLQNVTERIRALDANSTNSRPRTDRIVPLLVWC